MRKWLGGLAALVLAVSLGACGGSSGPTTVKSVGQVTVDDTIGLAPLIDLGHYDIVNSDINAANFSLTGKGTKSEAMVLVAFNRSISSEDADAGIRARGFRPANLDECLAYGAALAKARQTYDLGPPNYWIVCLGQSAQVGGSRLVPGLWGGRGRWRLDLSSWVGVWSSGSRFLAVRT